MTRLVKSKQAKYYADVKDCAKKQVEEIEVNKHNIKQFFRNCNQVKQGFKPQTKIISKEDGTMAIQDEEIVKEFSNCFEKL